MTQATQMRKLRIGIDGYNLALPTGTGVATYAAVLARTLRDAGHEVTGIFGLAIGNRELSIERFHDVFLHPERMRPRRARRLRLNAVAAMPWLSVKARAVTGADAACPERLSALNTVYNSYRLFDIAHRHFATRGRFLEIRISEPPDIMHWTYPLPICLAGARNIYTLHDLVPLKFPQFSEDSKPFYDRLVRDCIRHGDHICTVSEASKADIISILGAPPERVTNTYQSIVQDGSDDLGSVDRRVGDTGVPEKFFLYVGAIEPKKNVGRLVEGYLASGVDAPLVIVGKIGWQSESELALLGPGGSGRRSTHVIRPGYLPRAQLEGLVRKARAVLFPSLYEGFGIPVLEALRAGTPVLTSDRGGLAEVAGPAAMIVDPYDVSAISEGIRRIDRDADLRARMSADGIVHARSFSPDRYLSRIEKMYEAVLQRALRAL